MIHLAAILAAIKPLAKLLAGLKERHKLLSDRHSRSGTRIAPLPSRTMLHGKGTEAAQLNSISPRERLNDFVEHNIDDALYVTVIQMGIGA